MQAIAIIACLAVTAPLAWATTTGEHTASGAAFCYHGDECGPGTDAWGPVCHDGTRQSPIDIPMTLPWGLTSMNLGIYKGKSFRMQNNGHSVQVDFNNEGPSTQVVSLADPLQAGNLIKTESRQYKFSSAHFHWGLNDTTTGSEHCIAGQCAAMEIHFVHYLANYSSQAEAVASGNENALAVIGVFVHKQIGLSMLSGFRNNEPTSPLAPIVKNLESVAHADHDTTKWTTVNEPLNLSTMLYEAAPLVGLPMVNTYKGSLTTPGCNEQVNWYVLNGRAVTSHQELEAFRTIVKDGEGETLSENHRPLQPLNGRKVKLSGVRHVISM